MTDIAIQLHSLRAVDDPLPAVLERVGRTGFDGVEFAGLDAPPAVVATALDAHGLDAAGAHVDLATLESDPERAVTYRDLGCRRLTVPYLPPETFASHAAVTAAGDRLDAVARRLPADTRLGYHTHDHEFVALDGERGLDALLAATDVALQLDLGWAGAAGADPLAVLDRYADRVASVHLKDYDAAAGTTAPVGDGDLDLAAALRAVRDHDIEWLVYEAEAAPDSYATLDRAAAFVDDHW
jgi:sugar phosphate isomerase/epimerase